MTEAEWLTTENQSELLTFIRGKVSARKLRLLAYAVTRREWQWRIRKRNRHAVEMAEPSIYNARDSHFSASRRQTDARPLRSQRSHTSRSYAAAVSPDWSAGAVRSCREERSNL